MRACLDILQALRRSKVPTVRVVHDHNLYCLRGYRYNYFTRKICTKPVGLSCLTKCLGCITRNGFSLTSYSRKKQELSLVRAFDHVVAVSNYIKDQLVLNGFEQDRISVIHPVPKITKPSLRRGLAAKISSSALRRLFAARESIFCCGPFLCWKAVLPASFWARAGTKPTASAWRQNWDWMGA